MTDAEPEIIHLVDGRPQRDNTYRAIGRYAVVFSELIAGMREIIEARIAPSGDERQLAELALGSLMAQQIADPFFAICRRVGNLDPADDKIAKRLRNLVDEEIQERNRFMHGDWSVAHLLRPDVETPSAGLFRVKAKSDDPFKWTKYTVEEIDDICDRVELLRNVVWEYGTICTQQYAHDPTRGHPKVSVHDALEIEGHRVVYRGGGHEVPFAPT